MVNRNRFLSKLNDALVLEEIQVLPLINQIVHKLRASSLDDSVKIEVERKLWRLQVESCDHAKMLTGLMKKVMESESG